MSEAQFDQFGNCTECGGGSEGSIPHEGWCTHFQKEETDDENCLGAGEDAPARGEVEVGGLLRISAE